MPNESVDEYEAETTEAAQKDSHQFNTFPVRASRAFHLV